MRHIVVALLVFIVLYSNDVAQRQDSWNSPQNAVEADKMLRRETLRYFGEEAVDGVGEKDRDNYLKCRDRGFLHDHCITWFKQLACARWVMRTKDN